MYSEIIPKITEVLESVGAIKEVYAYPLPGAPKKYPAVIFYPDTTENAFETSQENMKVYRFKLWVVVGLGNKSEGDAYATVLPKAVDAVIQAFDTAWDGGTSVAGHRIWQVLDNAQWGIAVNQDAKEVFAEMNLTVRVLTNT